MGGIRPGLKIRKSAIATHIHMNDHKNIIYEMLTQFFLFCLLILFSAIFFAKFELFDGNFGCRAPALRHTTAGITGNMRQIFSFFLSKSAVLSAGVFLILLAAIAGVNGTRKKDESTA